MYGGIPLKFSYLQLPSYIDSFMPEMWLCKKYSCLQKLFLFFVSNIIGNTNLSLTTQMWNVMSIMKTHLVMYIWLCIYELKLIKNLFVLYKKAGLFVIQVAIISISKIWRQFNFSNFAQIFKYFPIFQYFFVLFLKNCTHDRTF